MEFWAPKFETFPGGACPRDPPSPTPSLKNVVTCSRPHISVALELLFFKEKNDFPLPYYLDVVWLINIVFPLALVTLIMMKCLFLLQCTNVASKPIKTCWHLFLWIIDKFLKLSKRQLQLRPLLQISEMVAYEDFDCSPVYEFTMTRWVKTAKTHFQG